MARYLTDISDIVNDYMLEMEDNDYGATKNATKVRNIAIAGLKDLRRSGVKILKSLILQVNQNTNSIELPNDFIDYARIGVLTSGGVFVPLNNNKLLGMAYQEFILDHTNSKLLDNDGIELTALRQVSGSSGNSLTSDSYVRYAANMGTGSYGANFGMSGGGSAAGDFRVDLENSRIFFSTSMTSPEVVLEYIADESMSSNPKIHEYCEEALMNYIYYSLIKRKRDVPFNEKIRARKVYANSKTLAIQNMNQDKSIAEIIMRLNKHTQMSPRVAGRVYR